LAKEKKFLERGFEGGYLSCSYIPT